MLDHPRVVLDSNVLISAFFYGGTPGAVFDAWWRDERYILVVSPELLGEVRRALERKFDCPPAVAEPFIRALEQGGVKTLPVPLTRICRDPKDNMVLDTALAGKAEWIVTGDDDLLALRKFEGITITSPRQFLWKL